MIRGTHETVERRKTAVEQHFEVADLVRVEINRGPIPRLLADLGGTVPGCNILDQSRPVRAYQIIQFSTVQSRSTPQTDNGRTQRGIVTACGRSV